MDGWIVEDGGEMDGWTVGSGGIWLDGGDGWGVGRVDPIGYYVVTPSVTY